MPKKVAALSAIEVRRLSERSVTHNTYFAVGGVAGLNLQVTPTGATSWILRTTVFGKRQHIGLGSYPDVELKAARERARKVKDSIFDGFDPTEEKRAALAAKQLERANQITFSEAAVKCHAARAPEFKNDKHKKQWIATLEIYAFPILGHLPVAQISVRHIVEVLKPIWHEKTETASRVRQRIESVMTWSKVQGLCQGENPARWMGNLRELLPSPEKIKVVRHHKALSWIEVPEFMQFLRSRGSVSARALEFLILTASRSKEVRNATWSEIDLQRSLWIVPADRMKAGREHFVPLSTAAVSLLSKCKRDENTNLIFFSAKSKALSDNTLSKFLRDADIDSVPHGFRSSFKDWARNSTEFADEVSELALAHVSSDATRAAYARDMLVAKRRELMEQWATFLSV